MVSEATGIAPDRLRRQGEFIDRSKTVPVKAGYWMITTKGNVRTDVLEDHFKFLLERLKGTHDFFYGLSQMHIVDFFICWHMDEGDVDLRFSSETIHEVARFGASIDFDIYD